MEHRGLFGMSTVTWTGFRRACGLGGGKLLNVFPNVQTRCGHAKPGGFESSSRLLRWIAAIFPLDWHFEKNGQGDNVWGMSTGTNESIDGWNGVFAEENGVFGLDCVFCLLSTWVMEGSGLT